MTENATEKSKATWILLLCSTAGSNLYWETCHEMAGYYHWSTFLQLSTIWFLLHFPHPFIPSELLGSWRNANSMSKFLFVGILPIIYCNGLQNVLGWPFCKFVAMCWAAKFKVWLPWSIAENTHSLMWWTTSRQWSKVKETQGSSWDFQVAIIETAWTWLSGSNTQYWLTACWRSSSVQSFLQ